MNTSEAKNSYHKLSKEQQTDFLIRFAHTLTIIGRECYDLDGSGLVDPKSLRYINEMQHRIMGAAMDLLGKSNEEKSRDWIIELMLEHENTLLKANADWAFKHVMASVDTG